MIENGMVLGVDRAYVDVNGQRTGQVRGLLQSGAQIEACYSGAPPWPLSTCRFEGPGEWFCLGPIGDQRPLLREDFLHNRSAGSSEAIGDTGWISFGSGVTSISTGHQRGAGVIRVTPSGLGDPYGLRKADGMVALPDDDTYWLSAKIRSDNPADGVVVVGLADAGYLGSAGASSDAAVTAELSAIGNVNNFLRTVHGVSNNTTLLTGEQIVDGVWTWVDLMVVGGQWAAMWVDGSGPWVQTVNVPDLTRNNVEPFVSARTEGSTIHLDVDVVHFDLVTPVGSPDGVAITAVPIIGGATA